MKFEFAITEKSLPEVGDVVMLSDYVDNPFMLIRTNKQKYGFVDLSDGCQLNTCCDTVQELVDFVGDWKVYPESKVVLQ